MNFEQLDLSFGKIIGIHAEPVALTEPFIEFAGRFADMPGTVVLMSGADMDCARFHILAAVPWLTLTGRNSNLTLTGKTHQLEFTADPFDTVRMLLNHYGIKPSETPSLNPAALNLPFLTGLIGYLAYDLKDTLEILPRTSFDDLCLPHICLYAPSILVIYDHHEKIAWRIIPQRVVDGQDQTPHVLDFFKQIISDNPYRLGEFNGDPNGFKSNFTRPEYVEAIRQIKEYIVSGHVYQVNMSQRFQMDFNGDGFALFCKLYEMNPAPFFAYIHAGTHQIVSTSPERFLARSGNKIETRPIKGTRPRGTTVEDDEQLAQELRQSPKDDAELSMIVDLLRNDIGKVCRGGTVRVAEHKRLEPWKNVWHMVSIVEGDLDEGQDSVDLIRATFPGGSITGCPKIRSMEIIDELEPNRRHIYTGSIGYISFHDTLDLSIAIRTATIYNGKIIFSVGGGIVFDSNPDDEFDETLHKGKSLMQVFQGKTVKNGKRPETYLWMNGKIQPVASAKISITNPGFQYGCGFFETIRAVDGNPLYLEEHMERFHRSWKTIFGGIVPDVTWNEIISQVLERNKVHKGIAAVKIIASKGLRNTPPFDYTIAVLARPYIHRLHTKTEKGLHLITYPHPRQTPLADHKTLNHLYYIRAGEWAATQGADEALILNPDHTVSETNSANIMIIQGKTVILPTSAHVLPGIMQKAVCNLLREWGYQIEHRKVTSEDLELHGEELHGEILVTNSLIGAIPALSLDGKRFQKPSTLWQQVNSESANGSKRYKTSFLQE